MIEAAEVVLAFLVIAPPQGPSVPRRQRMRGSMHPGWKCFFYSWFSGMMTLAAMLAFISQRDWTTVSVFSVFALVTFWRGGKLAEVLRPEGER